MKPAQALYRWYRALIFNPRYRGWVILATVLYLVSPFDISPDLFPILGQIDDVALIMLLVTSVYQWLTQGTPEVDLPRYDFGEAPAPGTEANPKASEGGPTIDVEATSVEIPE